MNIRNAAMKDYPFLEKNESHIRFEEIKSLINQNKIIVFELDSEIIGWLRWNLFWDNTPFMNKLYFLDDYRRKGYGRQLVAYWEHQMKQSGFPMVMTSSQSDEQAQHFYRRLGYTDRGSLLLPKEPLEIIFTKYIE